MGRLGYVGNAAIRNLLRRARTILVLGAHKDPSRTAHYVLAHLYQRGYRILPVNPRFAGEVLFGERVRADLGEIQEAVEILDVFRRGEALLGEVEKIRSLAPGVVWLQPGAEHPELEHAPREAGLPVAAGALPDGRTSEAPG